MYCCLLSFFLRGIPVWILPNLLPHTAAWSDPLRLLQSRKNKVICITQQIREQKGCRCCCSGSAQRPTLSRDSLFLNSTTFLSFIHFLSLSSRVIVTLSWWWPHIGYRCSVHWGIIWAIHLCSPSCIELTFSKKLLSLVVDELASLTSIVSQACRK